MFFIQNSLAGCNNHFRISTSCAVDRTFEILPCILRYLLYLQGVPAHERMALDYR